MKSEWTKPHPYTASASQTIPPFKQSDGIDWALFRRTFVEKLAEIGTFALVATIIIAFIAWLALMPSIGFLWLVGWL